jgi:hypothetical protein
MRLLPLAALLEEFQPCDVINMAGLQSAIWQG